MYKIVATLIFAFFALQMMAQSPQVPSQMEFAGIQLKITDAARRDIQSNVDALTRSEKYFQLKLARVDLYFPIIERILREQNVPEDFKYLVIQESSLVSDAVSTSDAVGYWQFKKSSGEEVGLRIDGMVDERMNISASTLGAARYLKRNNFYFDNWVYTMLSYLMGLGGAQSMVDKKFFGANKMVIDKDTHWYIIKFLSHKVAFENAIGKNLNPPLTLMEYGNGGDKSLREIAKNLKVDPTLVDDYNKWLKRGNVPTDKAYTVIIPVATGQRPDLLVAANKPAPTQAKLPGEDKVGLDQESYPRIEGNISNTSLPLMVKANGLPAIIARTSEEIAALAKEGGVSVSRFLKFNDLKGNEAVVPGQVYYFKNKRSNAPAYYHTTMPGETVWSISQKYAVKVNKLLRKNRMESVAALKPGRVMWLRFIRPKDRPIEFRDVVGAQVEEPNLVKEVKPAVEQPPKQVKNTNPAEEEYEVIDITDREDVDAAKFDAMGNNVDTGEVRIDVLEETEKVDEEVAVDMNVAETTKERSASAEEKGFEVKGPVKFVGPDAYKGMVHEVKQGETLSSISRQYEISKADLAAWNNIAEENAIKIGQKLALSGPEKPRVADAVEEDGQKYHVIQPKETLTIISKKYNISIADLQNWNELTSLNDVKIGQKILISAPVVEIKKEQVQKREEEIIYHKVKSGDTLYKIARDNQVTIKEVMEWNNKKDFNVAQGEVIIIKK